MNVQGIKGGNADFGAEARFAQARDLLAHGEPEVPETFILQFLGSIAPEDLALIDPAALAALTREAFAHVSTRAPGQPDVRVFNPDVLGGAVTVIETVNDDMAFLFDSVAGELADRGIELRLVAHPILTVERDKSGEITLLEAPPRKGQEAARESLIHLHIPALGAAERAQLKAAIEETLADVRAANEDFLAMRKQAKVIGKGFRKDKRPYDDDDRDEASDFIDWMTDDNFTFLGMRQYELAPDGGLQALPASGLGILRDPAVHELRLGDVPVVTTPEIQTFLEGPAPLMFSKASLRSRVHRRTFMDYVGIKTHDEKGRLTGELRIIGLLSATAYTHSVREIPYLRLKADWVLKHTGLDPESHSGRALSTVLETYPRDDLFQIDPKTLQVHACDILSLYDRPRVRVLPRLDPFDRFVSVLVYLPRDRYDSAVREAIGAELALAYDGHVSAFNPEFLQGVPLTRVHFIIGRSEGRIPQVDRAEIEKEISSLVMSWGEKLGEAIAGRQERDDTETLRTRYANAFGPGYRAAFDIETALAHIDLLERMSDERPIAVDFYHRPEDPETRISLRLLAFGQPLPLSTRVPMLENMGLKAINERTYRIEPSGHGTARSWLHDMTLERADGGTISMEAAAVRLEDCLNAVLRGAAENDGFNALVLDANLTWREAALVRALGRYLRQVGIPFSQDYLWETLAAHEEVAAQIVALFQARFDPALDGTPEARAAREAPLRHAIDTNLAHVSSLDQDRILRRFVNLVDAALRTTYYQMDAEGRPKDAIAIKFKSAEVEDLALPRPLYEVFVYAPRVEGIHLRFGPVARGGLRWSDRPQDFRTEILGLVKAQQVKNAVIVPVGAKGGFVPKRLPVGGPREAVFLEGRAAYELFVSSLLDLTDNLKAGEVVHPDAMVRLDGDDPYLVVAADKGTATFSDTANAISARHGFWLDDAFASGGSVGYDHKVMGITARGAWEAVKRHFREMNIDIQTTPVTVAGVGDMSGDVFGNGMLLSRAIKLVAAFDHRHIFLDPNPQDPERCHAERQRLFDLPRSSWADYDASLISDGGGVFPRTAKSIPLSAQIRALLKVEKAALAPNELINAILKAKVDLLFFGGIGTYIRASTETDAQAGDRANDAVRVAATELGAKVIGEGANLGMTQRARIEAARRGVKLNTDAIDNSAGVNTSDVEVNIKIALAQPLEQGTLATSDRAALLKEMTDDVALLVLQNNYAQTLALSLAERRGVSELAFQQRLMQMLELRGELDRQVEYLPSDMEISDRRSRGECLTRPELAVLLAYAKLALHADLLAGTGVEDPYFARELSAYFPGAIEARFPEAVAHHRLRRDIIATRLANGLINEGGPTAFARIADQTGADAGTIACAFVTARDAFRLPELIASIDALDNQMDGEVQLSLYTAIQDMVVGRTIWFLRNAAFSGGVESVVQRYGAGIAAVRDTMNETLPEVWREQSEARAAELVAQKVPDTLAQRLAALPALAVATDVALVSETTGRDIPAAAATFYAVGRHFAVDDLVAQARMISAPDYYDRLALDRALGELETFVRRVTVEILTRGGAGEEALEAFVAERSAEVERMRTTVKDIAATGLSLSKLTLAASLLSDLART